MILDHILQVPPSKVAFLVAVEQTGPSFSSQEALCPQVTQFLGWAESFGEAATAAGVGRLEHMLSHGGRLGEEVRRVWEEVRLEAAQGAAWLEEETEGVLASRLEDFGDGCTSGASRKKIVEAIGSIR